ncbi:hypothetical protein H7Y63_02555 [Polaromonas sp.]|nr:hypothetical protein [Candidatus Saccharibacteria bacterium]
MDAARLQSMRQAADHLSQHDPVMAKLVADHGLCTIVPHTDYYRSLVDSIIGQQLSVKAAAAIKQRFRELFGGTFPEPGLILGKTVEELRAVGLSYAKANYIKDLATHVLDGRITFNKIDSQTNAEIIAEANNWHPYESVASWYLW